MNFYQNTNTTYITSENGIIRCDCWGSTKVMFLSGLCVNEGFREQGEGTGLIVAAISHAKVNQCSVVTLEVHNDCQWLIDWYKRLGFMIVGYGFQENMFLMSKKID